MARALSSSSGRAAERRQEVGRQRNETLKRKPPRDVADVRVQAAILVDDDDGRQLAVLVGRMHEIALHLAVCAGPCDVLCRQPFIVGRHDLRRGGTCRQQRRDGGCGRPRTCQPGELVHEAATVERQMGVFVIGVDHRLGDCRCGHVSLPWLHVNAGVAQNLEYRRQASSNGSGDRRMREPGQSEGRATGDAIFQGLGTD